jgi:ABC-type uncharacterized transport system auxiliary subunit
MTFDQFDSRRPPDQGFPPEILLISLFALLVALLVSGCVVCYAPEARTFSLYSHVQNASNMVVNQDIPLTALRASASASVGSGNTITGIKAK